MVKLEGFAEFEAQLLAMAEGYRSDLVAKNTLVKAAQIAMEPVLADAVMAAPYDEKNTSSLHLKDSAKLAARIPNENDKKSDYVNETDAAIAVVSFRKSSVSLSQEFGNARVPGQPFLRVALERNVQRVLDTLKSQLAIEIPKYAKRLQRGKR